MDNGRNGSTSSGNSVDAAAPGSSVGSASSRPRPAAQNGSGAGAGTGTGTGSAHPVIKCPRCDSYNTKFCYYNNYSELQPRHFCKSCRRYWTNGGALRNVPVGGGCRKNKRLKQRPLLNMGVSTGSLLDPSSFMDETTSNMLARLSTSSPPFPNFTGPASSFAGNESGNHLFNLMFSRFQEPLRLAQSSDQGGSTAGVAPYLDVGFPGLVHMKHAAPHNCLCGACGRVHHTGCGGVMEGNSGFGILAGKGEHDVSMAGFCNSVGGGYELSSLYHDRNTNMHMLRTSATATLDSLEDQLSSFSNLQQGDAFDAGASGVEQKSCGSMENSENEMGVERASHTQQLVNGTGKSLVESAFNVDIQAERDMDERPLVSRIVGNNELSLLMSMDNNNWQQPPLMMGDLLMEPQTDSLDLWNSTLTNPRWQENMHSLAAPSAAAAGSVL